MSGLTRFAPSTVFFLAAQLLFASTGSRELRADPAGELAALSVFKSVDVNKLADGKPMMARGPVLSFPRGLAIESCYVIHKPVAKAVEVHRQWNAMKHPELKVYSHVELTAKVQKEEFNPLGSLPASSPIKSWVAATQKLGSGATALQMSQAEAKAFSKDAAGPGGGAVPPSVGAFWGSLLQQHAATFLGGGLNRLPAYENTGETVRVADEFARLLKEAGKYRGQFIGLLDATPLTGGKGGLTPSPYWEIFDVEGQAAAGLGAFYSKATGDTAQLVDAQYYCSGGYYALLSLYQLWPVKVGGQDATLVWRGDLISSASLAELHGVERMGSGAAMMRETQKAITAFLKDSR